MPQSPEAIRAKKAARQRRWRANQKKRQQVAAAVNVSLGLPPETPKENLPKGSDLAQMLRDRYVSVVLNMSDADLLNKDFASSLSVGLKAQGQIDAREKSKQQQGSAELAFGIISMLTGRVEPPRQLEDGVTIEGDFEEVDE